MLVKGATVGCIAKSQKFRTVTVLFVSLTKLHTEQTLESLHWRHNEYVGVSNHQPHGYLLNRLLRRRSKKTSKLNVTGRGPVNSPHKWPVTRKKFPFDDVIMLWVIWDAITLMWHHCNNWLIIHHLLLVQYTFLFETSYWRYCRYLKLNGYRNLCWIGAHD